MSKDSRMAVERETLGPERVESFLPAAPPSEMAIMQRMMGEFMASTVMSGLRSDVGAIARDFHEFKGNIAKLNSELGVFREEVILPVKRELEYLRFNLGARTEDNVGTMSKLVKHLEEQLDLLLRARGINPQARDSTGETVLDRMGVPPNRPNYQDLEQAQLLAKIHALADNAHGIGESEHMAISEIVELTKVYAE